jgi:hypothetical protein
MWAVPVSIFGTDIYSIVLKTMAISMGRYRRAGYHEVHLVSQHNSMSSVTPGASKGGLCAEWFTQRTAGAFVVRLKSRPVLFNGLFLV